VVSDSVKEDLMVGEVAATALQVVVVAERPTFAKVDLTFCTE
jgi:hypothetical protein